MDYATTNMVTDIDRQAMDMFYRNFCAVLKRNAETYEQLAVLESIGSENFGLISLGCMDPTDRGYVNFINLMNEYGIPYVEQRIAVKDSPNESVYIALDRNDIDIAENLRIEALKRSLNFRVSMDANIACDKIANSEKIKDKSVVTVKNLNLYEKELLKIKCQNISPAFNLYETEKDGPDGLTIYDVTLRDSKIMNINDNKNDFCKAYLQTLFGLYGYNSNHIIEHLNADLEVQLSLEENKDTDNTLYIVGANERRIKHYIEVNPTGFQMYVSTMKNGKRFDAEMQPLDTYKCSIDSEDYEEKLQAALNQLPSKTVLTTSRELNQHLRSLDRNIESTQPAVSYDEKIVAERERQIVELIDRAIKERLNTTDEYRFLKSGQEKFSYYINDTRNILSACINRTMPVEYDSSLILTINAMAEQVGMNLGEYKPVLDAIDSHEVITSMAKPKEVNNGKNVQLKEMVKTIVHEQKPGREIGGLAIYGIRETIKDKSKQAKFKIYLILGIVGYIYLFLVTLHYMAIRDIEKRISMDEAMDAAFLNVFTHPLEIVGHVTLNDVGLIFAVSIMIFGLAGMAYSTSLLKRHDSSDSVNGDAHFMNLKEYKKYCRDRTSPFGSESIDGFDNVIYSKEMRLSMNGFKSKRNTNTLVIGGSGAGKSRFFVGPNLLCGNSCFLCTDPSGELYRDYAQVLADMGYKIKVFNLTNVYEGSQYNPFHYIKEEADIFIIAQTIMDNTTPPDLKGGDPFWPKAELLLITSLMLYLWHTQPEEEQTFANLLYLITCAEVDENDSSKKSVLDQMFLNLEKEDPNNLAVTQYKGFKLGAGKTLKSILISVKARLQIFDLADIKYLTCKDTMEFEHFADTRQALFVIIPTADDTFNFVVSMMYTQFFMSLYKYCETRASYGYYAHINNNIVIKTEQAKNKNDSDNAKAKLEKYVAEIKKGVNVHYDNERHVYNVYTKSTHELIGWRGNKELLNTFLKELSHIEIEQVGLMGCPNHVHMICDEFSNISTIPNLDKRLSTMRKYNLSMDIILQAISQLKKMYKDEWNTIAGNCDVKLFLGSSDNETIKWLCETSGKKTTRVQTLNFNGKQGSSEGVNLSSRELITPDLLSLMKDDECLVLVKSERPYYGKKYNIEEHNMYDYAQTRKGMYEVEKSIDPELLQINIPFRERNNLKKGLEDFEKRKAEIRAKRFKAQNNAQKNASVKAKKDLEDLQEDIKKQKKERMNNSEAADKQQVDNMHDVMSQALYGDTETKVTSEEIVNMGDTKIQEVMESKINIEPYPLDEWTYMLS